MKTEVAPELSRFREPFRRVAESLHDYACGTGQLALVLLQGRSFGPEVSKHDPRRVALLDANQFMDQRARELAAIGSLRAFQVVRSPRSRVVRVNSEVVGTMIVRLLVNPADPAKQLIEFQFKPSPDEPAGSTNTIVFHWTEAGGPRAMIFWDLAPGLVNDHAARNIVREIRRSLPGTGARQRWDGLVAQVSDAEIVSLYFEQASDHPDPGNVALKALDALERLVHAGKPSRRGGGSWVPLHADSDDADQGPMAEGEYFGLSTPSDSSQVDAQIDLHRALLKCGKRGTDIIELHCAGFTDDEIGARLGITHQAVSKQRRRLFQMLRDALRN